MVGIVIPIGIVCQLIQILAVRCSGIIFGILGMHLKGHGSHYHVTTKIQLDEPGLRVEVNLKS